MSGMNGQKKGVFVFYSSENGRDNWKLVKPEDVPAWITGDPDVLGHIANGDIAMKCDEGPNGSLHYRADVILGAQDAARRSQALAERDRRESVRVLQQPSDKAFIATETSEFKH